MASGNLISCKQYASFLVSQEPVYDEEILRDLRPGQAELVGYYKSGEFPAYSSTEHTFDRFNAVQPDLTKPWRNVQNGNCAGTPCDPDNNRIDWGWTRNTYQLEEQSWISKLLCFDEIMHRTRAKEHFAQIIQDVLRPASARIMSYFLMRRAAELALTKIAVTAAGLAEFTFTWDDNGYVYLNTTADPAGRLTPQIIETFVQQQYSYGAMNANVAGYDNLQLHTDRDTFHYLSKDDPYLKSAWRFGNFGPAAKEFYQYGLSGFVGDFMVKVLQFPIKFNKVSEGRYQVVLPYVNVATTEGIKDIPNPDYARAQYVWSYINNPGALRVLGFMPQSVNPLMPFMLRDYGGKWRFATNDLGECGGKVIENFRGNKGLFYADFRLAIKPERPEWLILFFHKTDQPCVTIIDTCNELEYPYPAQDYSSEAEECPAVFTFDTVQKSGTYQINANTIQVDGNLIVNSAVNEATLAGLVAALPSVSGGTWAIDDADAGTIKLTGSTATTVNLPFLT